MSVSLKEGLDWLMVHCVLIAILALGGLATWQGLTESVERGPKIEGPPFFEFDIPTLAEKSLVPPTPLRRDAEPFQGLPAVVATKAEVSLDLEEIGLGMVAMSNGLKVCLTNGAMMREGQLATRFAVDRITDQGVWYRTEKERFFLKIGEKINVDQDGSVHKIQPQPASGPKNQTP